MIYIGIDAGGTSTRAVLANANGQVLAIGRGGTGNPNAASTHASAEAIRAAVTSALAAASAEQKDVAAIFVGMAGIVGDDDLVLGRKILSMAGLALPWIKIDIDHDIRIALAGGLPGQEGIALIVGTGSSCYGRTMDGRTHQSGGWGSVLDDGGSAFGLGHAAMRAAVRIADGRLPQSRILPDVIAALELTEIRQIVDRVYRTGISKAEVAALAPVVIAAWHAGDKVASDIVAEAAGELTWIVDTTGTRLGLHAPHICYTGGLIENAPTFGKAVEKSLQAKLPTATFMSARLPPSLGAVLLAYDLAGVPHSDITHARLLETYTRQLA